MVQIDKEKCISCGSCVEDCVSSNIEIIDDKAYIKKSYCLLCGELHRYLSTECNYHG